MSDDDNPLWIADSRPARADALKNRALLLETARRLFAEQGVEAVSMSAIAEAAGVGKGTLYRHFENKTALSIALLDSEMRDLQDRVLRRLTDPDAPFAKLRWFVEEVVRFVTAQEALLYAADPGGLGSLAAPAHIWWRQTLLGLLRQIRPASDVEYLADALYILIDVRAVCYLRRIQGYSPDRILAGARLLVEKLAG